MPIIPSIFVPEGQKINIVKVMIEKGWQMGVIKPLDGSSVQVTRFETNPKSLGDAQQYIDWLDGGYMI